LNAPQLVPPLGRRPGLWDCGRVDDADQAAAACLRRGGGQRLPDQVRQPVAAPALNTLYGVSFDNGLTGLQMGDPEFLLVKGFAIIAALLLDVGGRRMLEQEHHPSRMCWGAVKRRLNLLRRHDSVRIRGHGEASQSLRNDAGIRWAIEVDALAAVRVQPMVARTANL
jgi:hypothetical protein